MTQETGVTTPLSYQDHLRNLAADRSPNFLNNIGVAKKDGNLKIIEEISNNQDLSVLELVWAVNQMEVSKLDKEGVVISELIPNHRQVVTYGETGLEFGSSETLTTDIPLRENEVLILPLQISACGTDISLIEQLKKSSLPKQAKGKIVGHEMAGIIIGSGSKNKDRVGEVVCLDSHGPCELNENHDNFSKCVDSKDGCDKISGGIRGALLSDGIRGEPPDGYWQNLIKIPDGFMPPSIHPQLLANENFPLSTLESLGNTWRILGTMEDMDLLIEPNDTLLIVVGLGAIGGPLTAAAQAKGCQVIGIEPDEYKRDYALNTIESCNEVFANIESAKEYISKNIDAQTNIVIAEMSGAQQALDDSGNLLLNLEIDPKTKTVIVFGLFSSTEQKMLFVAKDMVQRDFVFDEIGGERDGVKFKGVCGRNMRDWIHLFMDLGENPDLVAKLKAGVEILKGENTLIQMMELMNQGKAEINKFLREKKKLKLAAEIWPDIIASLAGNNVEMV